MANIRIKCFHGYPDYIELSMNTWLDETGFEIEQVNVCSSNDPSGKSGDHSQVFCMVRYKQP